MRGEADRLKIERFMRELGSRVTGPGRIYFTGGTTAVLEGWRDMTVDVDVKALPEPAGFFEAIAVIKDLVDVNVELASPDDFIPALPDWRERSLFIKREGRLEFFHFDPFSQALAKIERDHLRDRNDVAAMLTRGLIERERLWQLFEAIEPQLIRYPAIDAGMFRSAVLAVCRPDPKM